MIISLLNTQQSHQLSYDSLKKDAMGLF